MRLGDQIESIRIPFIRAGASLVSFLSTLQARIGLSRRGPISVLIDSTILGHGITHETAWIQTGSEILELDGLTEGYAARIPVHSPDDDVKSYREVRYLAGIVHLARLGHLQFRTSAELQAEASRQPIGRFRGYGYFDFNLFHDIEISSVDGVTIDHISHINAKEAQLARVAACTDPLFQELLAYLGAKHSLDAYHIFTAEKHKMFCFLHIDFHLKELIRQGRNRRPISILKTSVLTPSEFGQRFRIIPFDTNLLSYENSNFPVRSDLSWPGKRRKSPLRHKKQ